MSKFVLGDKVKIKYDKIIKHPDYIKNKTCEEQHVIEYHNFVESNKDTILTVGSFSGHTGKFIQLKEWSKWLIHENDLELHIVKN